MEHFRIHAIDDPQSLPRVLEFFAQRAITPTRVAMVREDRGLMIDIEVEGLSPTVAAVIAAKLAAAWLVVGIAAIRPPGRAPAYAAAASPGAPSPGAARRSKARCIAAGR